MPIEAVVSLAQMGVIEIHTWNSTTENLERPNRLVWDLDPGPEVSWKQVVKAAELVRDVLRTLKLTSWVKATRADLTTADSGALVTNVIT